MDSRLGFAGIAFFLVAYAQTTPLFSFFSIKPNGVLILAIVLALSYGMLYEYAFLIFLGAAGLAPGIGVPHALFFCVTVFAVTRGILRIAPWQPFISGLALVFVFSFLIYGRLAFPAAREAVFNVAAFAALYAFIPSGYAGRQRIYQF